MIKITTLAFSLTKPSKNKKAIQVSVYKSTHPQQREKNQQKEEAGIVPLDEKLKAYRDNHNIHSWMLEKKYPKYVGQKKHT